MRPACVVIVLAMCTTLAACERPGDNTIVGRLESDRIEIVAQFFEPIVEIAISEGQSVAAGEFLLQQDDTRILARIRETEAALGQSRARVDELVRGPRKEQIDAGRASVTGARRELEFRRAEYERAQRVFEQELASAEAVDLAKAALDRAQADLQFHQARLDEMLSGTTVEELEQAGQIVAQMEARLASLRVDHDRHRAVAPIDAIVDSRLYEPGETPAVGQPMLILLSGKQPYARVYVPESLRVHVRPGVDARIHVDGLPESLRGVVRWVSAEAAFTPYFALTEHDRGRLTYLAKIDIIDHEDRLPDGVPIEVELVLNPDGS